MGKDLKRIVKKVEDEVISDDRSVKVIFMNGVIQVECSSAVTSHLNRYCKKNKHEYIDLETGELFECSIKENRGQNVAGVRRSLRNLYFYLNTNFVGKRNERKVTLTYRNIVNEPQRLCDDFENFIRRLRRRYKRYGEIEYIAVVEPCKTRDSWHIHCFLKYVRDKRRKILFMPNFDKLIPDMWGHGFADVKPIENENAIYEGLYFIKNLESNRVSMYPAGMKIFRCSSGIKMPIIKEMAYRDIRDIVGSAEPCYSVTKGVFVPNQDGSEVLLNIHTTKQFNLRNN